MAFFEIFIFNYKSHVDIVLHFNIKIMTSKRIIFRWTYIFQSEGK